MNSLAPTIDLSLWGWGHAAGRHLLYLRSDACNASRPSGWAAAERVRIVLASRL